MFRNSYISLLILKRLHNEASLHNILTSYAITISYITPWSESIDTTAVFERASHRR